MTAYTTVGSATVWTTGSWTEGLVMAEGTGTNSATAVEITPTTTLESATGARTSIVGLVSTEGLDLEEEWDSEG